MPTTDLKNLGPLDLIHVFEDLIKAFVSDMSIDGDLRRYYEAKREIMRRMGTEL